MTRDRSEEERYAIERYYQERTAARSTEEHYGTVGYYGKYGNTRGSRGAGGNGDDARDEDARMDAHGEIESISNRVGFNPGQEAILDRYVVPAAQQYVDNCKPAY